MLYLKIEMSFGIHETYFQSFTMEMKNIQPSECMNNVLKKYLKPKNNLLWGFEHK